MRAYKQLKVNEHAFPTMKTPLEIRPVYHRLEDRVRARVFICMLIKQAKSSNEFLSCRRGFPGAPDAPEPPRAVLRPF